MKDITKSWIEFAKRDFKSAEKVYDDEYLANIATFHSHQCVEKSLKALLSELDITFPKVHDIFKLYSLLPENVKNIIVLDENDLLQLDDIYIESRYPLEMGLLPSGFPTKEQVSIILRIARSIYQKILNYLEIENSN